MININKTNIRAQKLQQRSGSKTDNIELEQVNSFTEGQLQTTTT